MREQPGKIIIEPGLNVWPHELRTAEALAQAGFVVEFVKKSNIPHEKTADIMINGTLWEMKAPNGSLMKRIEKNIRRALLQSRNVVFDSRRMKNIPDSAIERELRTCANGRVRKLDHLLFVNRKGAVIDIK